jgi:hypothetical protein
MMLLFMPLGYIRRWLIPCLMLLAILLPASVTSAEEPLAVQAAVRLTGSFMFSVPETYPRSNPVGPGLR